MSATPDRARSPSGTCCSARSTASPLRPRQLLVVQRLAAVLLDAPADENLGLRMVGDLEAGAAQHGFDTGAVGYPPVGRVACIFVLHEIHGRIPWRIEMRRFMEVVVAVQRSDVSRPANHRLEHESLPR